MSAKSFEWHPTEDETIEFPCFTIPEYENLQGKVAQHFKAQHRAIADESAFPNQRERANFLRDSDPRSISPVEVEVFLNDDREARRVLSYSLVKSGKQPADAGVILSRMTVSERCLIARHVAGLIDLAPIPEADRKASATMHALIRKNYPGLDPADLTVGQFYELIEQLVPPDDKPMTPDAWFAAHTQGGTAKQLVA